MAAVKFKFAEDLEPSGLKTRVPDGCYAIVIESGKDVDGTNKETGEKFQTATFVGKIDPSEGVQGKVNFRLGYGNPKEPDSAVHQAWLALWMAALKKPAKEVMALLSKKEIDPVVYMPAKKVRVFVNVYSAPYEDKKTGESKMGQRVWPISEAAYLEAKAAAKSEGKGTGGKKKAKEEEDDEFDLGNESAAAAGSDDGDDSLDELMG